MNTKKIMSVLNPKSLLLFVFLLGTLMFSLLSLSMAVVQASADSPTLALKVENKNEKFNVVVTDSLEGLVPKELPNQLEIALEIKGLEAYNQAEFLENLKIMKGNEELSFKKKGISKKFNEENPQQLLIQLSKEVVTKLIKEGTTSLTFKTQFTLNKDDKALLESLNGDKITFNFLASSNLDEENVEKTCDLAIALPTGKAIPQTVMEGSSSDSLVAADLVKELKPAFDFDQVEVVGIEEQQSFDKAGEATVPVTIKSRETNLTNKIEVPITVRQNAPVPFKPNPKAVVDRPFLKDPLTTFVDKFGKKVEGKEVDENLLKNIVVLAYLGSDWKKDVILSIAAENGGQEKKWNGTMKKLYENDYLIVDKVAYKNGQYLKAKIQVVLTDRGKGSVILASEQKSSLIFRTGTGTSYHYPFKLEIEILDKDRQPFPATNVLLASGLNGPRDYNEITHQLENLQNVLVPAGNPLYTNTSLRTRTDKTYNLKYYDTLEDLAFNLLYSKTQTLSMGVAEMLLQQREFRMLYNKSQIYIPIPYDPPAIEGHEDKTTGKIKGSVMQFLPIQPLPEHYSDLEYTITSDYFANTLTAGNTVVKVTSTTDNKDYTSKVSTSFVESPGSPGRIKVKLTKETLQEIAKGSGNTVLDIAVDAQLTSDKKLMDVYNATTQEFKIPIAVENQKQEKDEDVATVHMLAPKGLGVSDLKVERGRSTDDYDASTFVKELESILPFDNVTAERFSTKTEFTKLGGPQYVIVVIKSQETGKEGMVVVPVTVVEAPLAYVSVTDTIKLNEVEPEKEVVKGSGEVTYGGFSDVNISVKTAPTIKLTNDLGDDIVDLNVYKSNKPLKDGELLTTLNQSNKSFSFDLITHKSKFKKVSAYKGKMKVIFEIP